MKKLYSILALVLCVVMIAFCFTSCNKNKKGQTTATTESAGTNPPATTAGPDPWESIALEVNAIAPSNRSFKISYDVFTSAERVAKNDQYIKGPDAIEEGVTSTIQQMVYKRNEKAKDLLGLTIEYATMDKDWNQQCDEIVTLVQGNAVDAPDLFINMVFDLNIALKTQGVFRDIKDLPGAYFDFDSDKGWMTSWMESYSFTGDRAYILASDYFLDVMRAMGVLPFNMDLMNERSADLASTILEEGDTLATDEDLSSRFFDYVDRGFWTWDTLSKLCAAVWQDADGSGGNTVKDTLGIMTDRYSGMPAALILFSTGETLTETTTDDSGRVDIQLKQDAESVGAIFDAVKSVFNGPGSFVTAGGAGGATEDNPGLAYSQIKFSENTLLFAGPTLLGALENDTFQQMTYTYSVVPMPKADVNKDYNTIVHNTADVGAINVKTAPQKAIAISAFLQHCTENSGNIREEFLQIVTKYRTTTYNQGTSRMLDLIYDSLANSRDKAIEDASMRKSGARFHGVMKDNGFIWGSADIVSWYESNRADKQAKIEELLNIWYDLPTNAAANENTEPAAE